MLTKQGEERPHPDLVHELIQPSNEFALKLWEERGVFDETGTLITELTEFLNEVGTSIPKWSQDERDAAEGALNSLASRHQLLPDLNASGQSQIAQSYINCVRQLGPTEDWLGAPWTIMEIGKGVARILGKEQDFVQGMRLRGELAEAWSEYTSKVELGREPLYDDDTDHYSGFSGKDLFRDSLLPQLRNIQNSFLPRRANIETERYERSSPPLDKTGRELAAWYGKAVSGNSSAKLRVLRACPDYISEIRAKGVNISHFWNLANPAEILPKIDQALSNGILRSLFTEKFEAKFSYLYEETTDEEREALADASIDILRDSYLELSNRQVSFIEVKNRILAQLTEAKKLENPYKKLKPVLKWIRQIEPEFTNEDPNEIQEFINQNEDRLRAFYGQKNIDLREALDLLSELLPHQSSVVRFMDRDLFDLKSANLTADCTAWNMEVGFNAWTVPVWVTNPSFNFAYIEADGKMLAKFGMILAFDGQSRPGVIIDSIETNKNLGEIDNIKALETIYKGFADLQDWADRNDFGTIRVCTFTNSTELTAALPITDSTNEPEKRRFVFDGTKATRELIFGIDPALELPEIYLQAKYLEFEDDEDIPEGAREFEKLAQNALEQARQKDTSLISEQDLLGAFQSGDSDKIINGLVASLAPGFATAFEFNHQSLSELYWTSQAIADKLLESLDTVFHAAVASYLSLDESDLEEYGITLTPSGLTSSLTDSVRGITTKLSNVHVKNSDALIEVLKSKKAGEGGLTNLDPLLNLLEAIEVPQINIEKTSKYIFGRQSEEASSDRPTEIPLRRLPIYDRDVTLELGKDQRL